MSESQAQASNSDLTQSELRQVKLKKWFNSAIVFVVTFLVAALVVGTFKLVNAERFIEALEKKTYDVRFNLPFFNANTQPSQDIVIVAFDDPTMALYEDRYGTWPWPRKVHADVIRYLNSVGARLIAYDLMFKSSQLGLQASDLALVEAYQQHTNVFVGMNLDRNDKVYASFGRDKKRPDVRDIASQQIALVNHLDKNSPNLKLDQSGFYKSNALNYDSFRPLMPGMMQYGERIGILNHARDEDGISRANPLIFKITSRRYQKTESGTEILDASGKRQIKEEVSYYPYMALRLLMADQYPKQNPAIELTPEGKLKVGKHLIPLASDGSFLINWYHGNAYQQILAYEVFQQKQMLSELRKKQETVSAQEKQALTTQINRLQEQVDQGQHTLDTQEFPPMPYPTISAAQLLMALEREQAGATDKRDEELRKIFKDKIVFVGTTAVTTQDIKATPVNAYMPGVLLQAQVFDNIRQNHDFIVRVAPQINMLVMFLLSATIVTMVFKTRSGNASFVSCLLLMVIYLIVSTALFVYARLWLDIVMPMLAMTGVMMASYMAKYIKSNMAYERTYALATTDSMTGLYNHRYFQETMSKSIARSQRYSQKFSLVLIDIDFFKKFNDTYGHQAGDEVLRCVARKLKKCVRAVDMVARYGGEEMAVVLDKANEEEALAVAKKLVEEIANEAYPIAEGVYKHVTISVGVSTYPTHGLTTPELIEFSDKGLYRAKENGRNQVGAQYDEDVPPKPEGAASGHDAHGH